ncbi:SH3 domain-containing protein [Streptomyces sp. Edi2]|uniref:SH3 domain-containing protein n=1 Tax=Streptomyces sp. Edi2 TaxID=3162528 RepID=UPI003305CB0A
MRSQRISVLAATAAAIALPVLAAPAANAAPAATTATQAAVQGDGYPCPVWKLHAKAVNLRAKPSSHSRALGVLYRSHKFKVHSWTKRGGGWVNVTDTTTGIRGWASGNYLYSSVSVCH